jgi:hypothetical protein
MKLVFKILIGSSIGVLGLSLLFFFTQQTLAGRFLVIKTGLSVSSVLALIALILFTFSLGVRRKLPYSSIEEIVKEESIKLEKILRVYLPSEAPGPGRKSGKVIREWGEAGKTILGILEEEAINLGKRYNTDPERLKTELIKTIRKYNPSIDRAISYYERRRK